MLRQPRHFSIFTRAITLPVPVKSPPCMLRRPFSNLFPVKRNPFRRWVGSITTAMEYILSNHRTMPSQFSMSSEGPKFVDGKINFVYQDETYQTYFKHFGDLENRKRTPVVVLHGGPGLCHNYLVPFADLAAKYDIPVILYDQLGNAKSTHLKDKPPTFWTIDLFIDELVNLLNHFKIQDDFALVGHSWGGILATEFEVRRQPAGLKSIVLSSSLAASSLWNQSNGQLLSAFPDKVKQGMMGGMKEPVKFFEALKEFHAVHGCVIRPVPESYWYTLEQVFGADGDPTVASAPYVFYHLTCLTWPDTSMIAFCRIGPSLIAFTSFEYQHLLSTERWTSRKTLL